MCWHITQQVAAGSTKRLHERLPLCTSDNSNHSSNGLKQHQQEQQHRAGPTRCLQDVGLHPAGAAPGPPRGSTGPAFPVQQLPLSANPWNPTRVARSSHARGGRAAGGSAPAPAPAPAGAAGARGRLRRWCRAPGNASADLRGAARACAREMSVNGRISHAGQLLWEPRAPRCGRGPSLFFGPLVLTSHSLQTCDARPTAATDERPGRGRGAAGPHEAAAELGVVGRTHRRAGRRGGGSDGGRRGGHRQRQQRHRHHRRHC